MVFHLTFFIEGRNMVTTITAHRGASGHLHENTLEAFNEAINIGANAIELDVRKSKDNKLIIMHNDHINENKLCDLNYNEILNISLNLGFKVPTLLEVLLLCKGKIFLDIELKEEGYEEEIITLITEHLDYQDFYIRSFLDRQIIKVKKLNKNIKTGLLLGTDKAGIFKRLSELFPLFRILRTKCDFVSPHYRLIVCGYIKRMHLIKKPVLIWTVNDKNLIKKLIKKKADGIITDYPELALNILNN